LRARALRVLLNGYDMLRLIFSSRKNALHHADEWLEGEALDAALEEVTKDYPDLLQLVDSLDDKEDLLAEYEELEENCREDEEYLCLLKHSIKNLK